MIEQVVFMNMCMLEQDGKILALDKVGKNYSGTTFPGGHVEAGETFCTAMIREMQEETGYLIQNPVLKGIYHWYKNGLHNVGLLYKATEFSGTLKSSEEGKVYWISKEDYEKKDLAEGMRAVLQIMDSDAFCECFQEELPDGSYREYLS